MNIDFLKIKDSLLKYYKICNNTNQTEFYRGMCWMENTISRILEKNGFCETTEQQLLAYLEEQLNEALKLIAKRDDEIRRLTRQNQELIRMGKKDRRMLKKDINISILCKENRKLIKERDYLLNKLHSGEGKNGTVL